MLGLGQRGELEELGDAADPWSVGLHDVLGAGLDQPGVLGDAGQHLAGRNRGVQRAGEVGVALGVVGIEGFLDPDQVVLLQQPTHPLRGGPVPLLVGVDHHRHVIAQVLTDPLHAGDVGLPVGQPDLDLDAADAAGQGVARVLRDLLDRGVQEPAGGVVGANRVAVRAEQLGQRQAGPLGLEVPQGDVEGGDRLGGQAAAAHRCAGPDQLGPDLADVAGVLPDQHGRDLLGVGELAGAAGPLGVAEPDCPHGRPRW